MGTTQLINLQLRMLLLIIGGIVLKKIKIVNENTQKSIIDLIINLILPCNIIKSFMVEFNMDTLKSFMIVLLISMAIQAVCTFLGHILFNHYASPRKKVLQYATAVSNAGFIGNPVVEGVFGTVGLSYASVYLIPQRIVMWSAGISYFTTCPSKKALIKKLLTHPCIIAVEIGLILLVTQLKLPVFLTAAITDLSNCNTGLSMLFIGFILADLDIHNIFDFSLVKFSILRLILIPLGVYIPCMLLNINPIITGSCVLLAAMPAATTTAILASKYNGDAGYASKCIIFTTLLSLISTPIWSMILL